MELHLTITKEQRENMKIDIDLIRKNKMTIQYYLDLRYLYFCRIEKEEEFVDAYGGIDETRLRKYAMLGFIHLLSLDAYVMRDKYQLRNPIRDLFEGEQDLFLKWFSTFPLKTPSGRYLRPGSDDTITGKKLRQKWNKHFKNNTLAAKKAITVLEAEMSMRRQTGKFEYMHNAETWLNKGDYEIYAELLEKKNNVSIKTREDYE